jgi:glucokinase
VGLETNPARADLPLAIGIDIGGTGIKSAIVNLHGELLDNFQAPSPRSISELRAFVQSVLKREETPVRGIGVGCKGIIEASSTMVKSCPGDLCFLEGRLLSEAIGVGDLEVCAENDARAALVGEALWGAARGHRNVVMLTLGTGVGGAVLVDGVILHGASGAAGHLGHTTINPGGGLCICGNYGCLETHFSSRALESDYWAHMHRAAPAKLVKGPSGEIPNPAAIFQAAQEGDECAHYVVDRALTYLSAAIISFLHIFDPEILVLGGNIANAGEQLITPIQEKIAKRTKILLGREVPIAVQTLVGYGGVAGAAGLVFLKQNLLTL